VPLDHGVKVEHVVARLFHEDSQARDKLNVVAEHRAQFLERFAKIKYRIKRKKKKQDQKKKKYDFKRSGLALTSPAIEDMAKLSTIWCVSTLSSSDMCFWMISMTSWCLATSLNLEEGKKKLFSLLK